MSWLVLKPLRQSELGWFEACRANGRETSRQRALNVDASLVERLFMPKEDQTDIPVLMRWFDGVQLRSEERRIRKQKKNWRLIGNAVEGARFSAVQPDDPIVLLFEQRSDRMVITWDVIPAVGHLGDLHRHCNELLADQTYRLLSRQEAGRLLPMLVATVPAFSVGSPASRPRDPPRADRGQRELDFSPRGTERPAPTRSEPETTEKLPPENRSFILALRSMGYRLEEAVGDLVDNSIQAEATTVLVRLVTRDDHVCRILIIDDGHGMDEATIRDAFRLGLGKPHEPDSLSKFGMGLKLASISQCRSLTVVSAAPGQAPVARRWTVENMESDWRCVTPAHSEILCWRALHLPRIPGWQQHGTMVVWDDLDRIPKQEGRGSQAAELKKALALHLGLHFHRFIDSGRLRILLNLQEEGDTEPSHASPVEALDPFGYPRTGVEGFPRPYLVHVPGIPPFRITAHIWPARVDMDEFRLDGPARRAGFYLYRNDRLIVAGGWLGVRQANKLSPQLARIAFDVPPALDHLFQLDIRKAHLQPPPGFDQAVNDAKDLGSEPLRTFRQYLEDARAQTRAADGPATARRLPLVPGEGFPKRIRDAARDDLMGEPAHEVGFQWADLQNDELFFEIDLRSQVVYLNSRYRRTVNAGRKASPADAVLMKSSILLMLLDHLSMLRTTSRWSERMAEMNRLLVRAARYLE